jgi:hypothetical protein
MKLKKFVSILALVIVIAAVFVVPVFAQGGTPPVEKPAFDMAAISQALQTLILAIAVPVTGFLARWLLAQGNAAKSQLNDQQLWMLNNFLKTLVYAAEQMSLSGAIDDKLDWVIARANEWLDKYKINIDLDELRARIEAIVAEELNKEKFLPAPLAE